MEAVGTRNLKHLVYEDQWNMRLAKNRSFNKYTQIKIYYPKQRETFMKSKTEHVDGGVVFSNLKHVLYDG